MTDRLDAVAIGIAQKRRVVVFVISRANAGRSVGISAIRQPNGMKYIDRCA